jgi:hypothetical protein
MTTFTYEDGERLGCPDCASGEPHCCAVAYAVGLPEPRRERVLTHVLAMLSSTQ